MPSFCSAYGCSNNSHKEECRSRYVSFHAFPLNNPELLQKWMFNMKRANFIPKVSSRLCSDHFEEDCFHFQNFTNRREVKKNAVPTKFNFKSTTNMRMKKMYDGWRWDKAGSTAYSDQSDDAFQSPITRKRKKATNNKTSKTSVDKPKVIIVSCKPVRDTEEKQSEDNSNMTEAVASYTVSLPPNSPQPTEYSIQNSFCEERNSEMLYEDCEDVVERRHKEKMQKWDTLLGLMEQLVKKT